jgi:glutamyl-tRNA synthetase, bacterial family
MRKVRVRFAPSPTGPLHIGGVRTALYNYLFARQHNGDFILRIEDTDSQRFVEGAEKYIIDSLNWLNVYFNEGVGVGGDYGPYKQSERRDIYKKHVQLLLDNGKAYIAFDTPQELEAKRAEINNFQYDASTRMRMRNSLTLTDEEVKSLIAEGHQYVVRMKIEPNEDVHVNDLIRGDVIINSSVLDDKVLYKSADELPTYHLANIVDDHLMEVTHVIRGEEWLPSAPLHVLLYRAFGWEDTMPAFAHLPLLLKPEGNGKLSKRDGDRLGFPVFPLQWTDPVTKNISSGYREAGYLPEALINFLALLGWNPGNDQDILSMEDMIGLFDLSRCSKSGAKFDYKKGVWFNHQYIQLKGNEEIAEMFQPILKDHGVEVPLEKVATIVGLVKERVNFVQELWDASSFFFIAPQSYDEKTVKKRWKEDSAKEMVELADVLSSIEDFTSATQEKVVMDWVAEKEYHTGNIMNAFRLAIVGEGKGPHMFDITTLIGKEETISRLEKAAKILG